MKKEMSALDIMYVLREMSPLIGGRIRKIYQDGKRFSFEIFLPGKGSVELLIRPTYLFLTEYKRRAPITPPSFCMFLRKHLNNRPIRKIIQHRFDRIVEIHTEENILILELFSRGNVILCDTSYKIIMPLEVQKWKDREILPKSIYKYPPSGPDPTVMDFSSFRSLLGDKEIVRILAVGLGFGGTYAEEICARAGIDKSRQGSELDSKESIKLYNAMKSLFTSTPSPRVIYEGEAVDVVPFEMLIYRGKEQKSFETFIEALDTYFSGMERKEAEEKEKEFVEEHSSRIQRIKEEQERAAQALKEKSEKRFGVAETIYRNYSLIDGILSGLRRARASGKSWDEIKRIIKEEDSEEARVVKEIREGEGTVVIEIDGEEIKLDFTKSVEENAERLYQDSKKAREKLKSLEEHMERVEEVVGKPEPKPVQKPVKKRRKKWYEKFRWFYTSENFLVIGGRDATQNEMIIKKYLDPVDVVLHADIHGAPFVVVKSEGKEITPLSIREAAEFAAAYSSAWKEGYGSVDVYWVRPDQVSKEAPSGEFLPKGAFMIRGQKNYLKKMELKLSIGVRLNQEERSWKVLCGSTQSVRSKADYFVTIKPGHLPNMELAKEIKRKIMEKALPLDKEIINEIPLDEFQRLIPGNGIIFD